MYGSSYDGDRFVKNFCFNPICIIIQELQELQRYNCACGFISKSAVIIYNQLLSKVITRLVLTGKKFDQLPTASSSTPP